jgi:hypothetical protein
MGRYDFAHFEVEDEDVVSIWASIVPYAEIPEDYFTYNFAGGDNDPWNRFSSDFGFGYYDDDFVESYFDEPGKRVVPIGDLISPLSYSPSFIDAVEHRAKELGLEKTSYVFLIYNFKYEPSATGKDKSDFFQFLGTFPFDQDAS